MITYDTLASPLAVAACSTTQIVQFSAMSHNDENNNSNYDNTSNKDDEDDHEHDMVMPGFRFRPTEEELIEFYLRRKVEGKHFNVELITFLDLYSYDPWELPALAAIGEKEWFFYVPRDRKYRNGDRPNRHETERYRKRAGIEDHPSLPRSLPSRASSSRGTQSDKKHQSHVTVKRFQPGQSSQQIEMEKTSETDASGGSDVTTALGLSQHNINAYHPISPSLELPASVEEAMFLNQSKQASSSFLVPNCTNLFTVTSSMSSNPADDDLHRLINYQQADNGNHQQQQQFYLLQQRQTSQLSSLAPQSQPLPFNMLPTTFPDRLWDWNQMQESNIRDYNNPFK
ncbi:hypothetical protein SADUNF_Sadunf01G0185100 [Salix dunnii]|uniref:NAC domain-containing protein n=1 Tax=Salix dunnii TaxID=1413687 RepID=A0A835NCF4_9ROSI|nr:hypothetical protein SADUNF_Sadunf01G0185100 [Salix dunnii]